MSMFLTPCFDGKGHAVQFAPASTAGYDDRTLCCGRCGQAVPLKVAIARTLAPSQGLVEAEGGQRRMNVADEEHVTTDAELANVQRLVHE